MAKRRKGKSAPQLGARRSARRDAVLSVILMANGALTAEEIHEAAAGIVPGLGIATVYRNLKLLHEAGVIQQIILSDGQTRYERSDQKHHHHFQCTECSRIFCLEGCVLPQAQPDLPKGFTVTAHEITLYGTCPDCSDP